MKPKIIFIHGMFLNAKSWEDWVVHFSKLGYECSAPSWPSHEGTPSHLRLLVPEDLGSLSLEDVRDHYRNLLREERTPIVLIGHSLGGLLVQELMAEGLAVAAVAICPVAPNGMLTSDWGFLRNALAITNPLAGSQPYEMDLEDFQKNFANTISEAESRKAYDRYITPESRQVLRDAMGQQGKVDVSLPHAPLLFVGAEKDEIIPPSLVMRNSEAYIDNRSHSEYVGFSGRSHLICNEPLWEEVAERVANWLVPHLSALRS
jgi:esterase/lipase